MSARGLSFYCVEFRLEIFNRLFFLLKHFLFVGEGLFYFFQCDLFVLLLEMQNFYSCISLA